MTDPAENRTIPPFRLAVAAVTGALCVAIIYNALAGQDGRQRDVLSRLGDLEQHDTLPVTIGVGAFDGRPTTKSAVTLEQLAELAASESERDVLATEIARELKALGYDGDGSQLRESIAAYQRDHDLEMTGAPTSRLLDHIRFIGQINRAVADGPAEVDVRDVQEGLARLGYAPGPLDGVLGARTRDAIRKFEQDRGLAQTGTITDALAQEVLQVLSGAG